MPQSLTSSRPWMGSKRYRGITMIFIEDGEAARTTTLLTDLIPRAHPKALARVLDLPIDPRILRAVASSRRLLRRWSELLQDAAGLAPSVEHDDTPLLRSMLRGSLAELDAVARIAGACLAREEIRRTILGSEVAQLRHRHGDDAYAAALAWEGGVPMISNATGWDAMDAWIATREPALQSYLALRRPQEVGDHSVWTTASPEEILDYAAGRLGMAPSAVAA